MSGASGSAVPLDAQTRALSGRLAIRAPLLAIAALGLLAGLYGGLARLGWTLPLDSLGELHGPLMISGLFGTLISLERAVALARGWAYAAPALSALGTLALLFGAPAPVGAGAYALAAAALTAVTLLISLRQPAVFTGTLLFGALAWLTGNILWARGVAIPDLVGWWLSFLVLTVAAERLELSRLMAPKRGSEAIFLFGVAILLAGAQNGIASRNGAVLFGLGLLLLTGWLFRHDIARLNVRRTGQTRFMAVCMVSGYVWLAAAGVSLIAWSPDEYAFGYDVALHAIVIGFVLSMVFGHALIILPAVARLRVRYAADLYGPLVLLHVSIALRAGSGWAEWSFGRMASGPLTACALAGFGLVLFRASRARRPLSIGAEPRL